MLPKSANAETVENLNEWGLRGGDLGLVLRAQGVPLQQQFGERGGTVERQHEAVPRLGRCEDLIQLREKVMEVRVLRCHCIHARNNESLKHIHSNLKNWVGSEKLQMSRTWKALLKVEVIHDSRLRPSHRGAPCIGCPTD